MQQFFQILFGLIAYVVATGLTVWVYRIIKGFLATYNLLKAKLTDLEKQVDEKESERDKAVEQLRQILVDMIAQSTMRIDALRRDLDASEARSNRLEAELDTLRQAYQAAQVQITQLSLELNRRDTRIAELERLNGEAAKRIAELERLERSGRDGAIRPAN